MRLNKDKLHHTYSISDFYKSYEKERKTWDKRLTKKEYVDITKEFFFELSSIIIRETYSFKFPYRMGTIRIKKLKSKPSDKMRIDWAKTKKIGKVVRHINMHTDGKTFKWYWEKPRFSILNQSYYTFKATRDEKRKQIGTRGLANYIKECSVDPYKKDYNCLP
jgi:hypothetical protein